MRTRIILHYLGLLIATLGISMLIPLGISLLYQESDSLAFAISAGFSLISAFLVCRLTSGKVDTLRRRETITIVVGAWVIASIYGALPYFIAGTFHSYLDACFESMSGFTTTGASVLTDIDIQPHGILLWRSLTQWLGGMGIITLFVALFPVVGIGAARLVEAETANLFNQKMTARIRDTVRIVWLLYLSFSVLEVILLCMAKMPIFDAVTVTFSTISTGGFAPTNLSIATYNNVFVEIVVIIFMIIGATNFVLYYQFLWNRKPSRLFSNPEFRFYIALLGVVSILVILDLILNKGVRLSEAIRYGSFNTLTIMTTTGFATADYNTWPEFSRILLLASMIIGGSAGSTGGGIKVIRFLILLKYIYRNILHTINPQLVIPLKVGQAIIPENILSPLINLSVLYIIVLITGCLILTTMGIDSLTAFSAVAATMGSVGPGLGLVGPMANFFWIPPLGKILLIICMLLGRLELFTVLALLVPAFWRRW